MLLVRDQGFIGGGIAIQVEVDRVPLVRIRHSERIEFYLQPGRYMLTMKSLGAVISESPGESEVMILEKGLNDFRLRLVPGDEPRVERSQQLR